MFGPGGNPTAANLFNVIGALQDTQIRLRYVKLLLDPSDELLDEPEEVPESANVTVIASPRGAVQFGEAGDSVLKLLLRVLFGLQSKRFRRIEILQAEMRSIRDLKRLCKFAWFHDCSGSFLLELFRGFISVCRGAGF